MDLMAFLAADNTAMLAILARLVLAEPFQPGRAEECIFVGLNRAGFAGG
jgi:hypothetical protein